VMIAATIAVAAKSRTTTNLVETELAFSRLGRHSS